MEGAAPRGQPAARLPYATRRSSPSRMSNRSPLPAGAEDHANQLGPVVVNLSGCPLYSVGKGLEHVVTALGSA